MNAFGFAARLSLMTVAATESTDKHKPHTPLPAQFPSTSLNFLSKLREAGQVEDLRNRIPLRQFEIFERVKLKHQTPQFVAEDLGMTRAMNGSSASSSKPRTIAPASVSAP
jgi:hypothetical protein